MDKPKFLIVTPVIDMEKFNDNLAISTFFEKTQSVILKGFTNVSAAQNMALKAFDCDYMIFIHEDVFLPETFEADLENSIAELETNYPDWYVAGCAGVRLEDGKKRIYGHCQDRGNEWGKPLEHPVKVETVDELLIVVNRKRHIVLFDENIPANHFYSAGLSLEASLLGYQTYAINAYCHHNSDHTVKGDDFWESKKYMEDKWADKLPIVTTCTILQHEQNA